MLPWTKKENLNVFHGEYAQAGVPNRIFNRLMDNDNYLKSQMDLIEIDAANIGFATIGETQALTTSASVIRPAVIMSLSATPSDILSGGDTRFVTANGHVEYMDDLTTGVSYIDITHLGVHSKWPTASAIQEAAQTILVGYTPPGETNIDVAFYVDESPTTYSGWYSSFFGAKPSESDKKVIRYRYSVEALTTNWTYLGRLTNMTGRLYQ